MKYLIFSCIFMCISFNMISQDLEGLIVYEDKVNIHKNLPPEMEAMKENIPEFRTSKHLLAFNKEETYYSTKKEEAKEQEFSGNRRGRRFRGRRNNNKIYTNLQEKTTKSSQDLFGKVFLVTGDTKTYKWKITGEQKQVGSYLCQKATFQDSTTNMEVWFTPMIPISAGPAEYGGLPGLILHVDIDDGIRQITAQDISLQALEDNAIVKPTEGEEISKVDFRKIREEKMKEMEAERGKRGGKSRRWRRGH